MNTDFNELGGRDPHAVLGLQQGASPQEVARAFRRSAVQGAHPDKGGDNRRFRQLARARDVLLDPQRLAAYNATRQAAGIVRESYRAERSADAPSTPYRERPHGSQAAPSTPFRERPQTAPNGYADNGARTVRAEPRPSSVASGPAPTSLLPIIVVGLALAGPLLWPVAIFAVLLALMLGKRSGRRSN